MNQREKDLWQGINARAQDALSTRNYRIESFGQELSERGVEASQLTTAERKNPEIEKAWIPGVEIFSRKSIRSVIADLSANLSGGTKGFFRRSAFGRSNGRQRACLS